MEGQNHRSNGHAQAKSTTPRDLVAVVFRRRRLILYSFLGILLLAVLAALILPEQYQAQMVILVNRERVDPVVTSEQNNTAPVAPAVTEQDLNSEVALLQSQDLLEKVVRECKLYQPKSYYFWARLFPSSRADAAGQTTEPDPAAVEKAARKLAKQLNVEWVNRSNLITVSYETPDPQLSARVLNTLEKAYLEKHAAVHRPTGTYEFFHDETAQYGKALADAETRLVAFTSTPGAVVAGQMEKDLALQKLSEFDASLQQTQAEIAGTEQRIRSLETQLPAVPARMTTQVRTADNGQLYEQLMSTLLTLELKRTELLSKFEPTYRPVQDVETQIAQTRAAIAAAEKSPVRDETTDRDPTHEWLRGELAKAQADLAGLQARAAATAGAVNAYQKKARWLGQMDVAQEDLTRKVKVAEDSYLMYLRKQEEARISDALDRNRIVNVSIAQTAAAPVLPAYPQWLIVVLGAVLALVVSTGVGFGSDYLDPTFNTPDELASALDIPVLLTVPKKKANGDGVGIHVS
ncbi:MAG: hypothetical protein LAN62_03650 [Acidobacteriia bacterium]|nr:hypothetical protein [Terriglobia bacterium]